METVTIDDVQYVKASVLAKRHNYTADYIGQLCRARKVDAHLVGRTWYVYPPSLDGHKTTRYSELRSNEKTIHNSLISESSRRDVVSPVSKKTVKSQSPHFHDRVFWKNPKYQGDTSELLPEIKKQPVPLQEMKIELADSERVRVASASKNVTMISQPMPAVALAGTLKVLDYAPDFDEVYSEPLSNAVVENTSDTGRLLTENEDFYDERVSPRHEARASLHSAHGDLKNSPIPPQATYPVAIKKGFEAGVHAAHAVTSASIKGKSSGRPSFASTVPLEKESDPKAGSLFLRLVIAPAVVLLTLTVATAMLVVESVTSVGVSGEEDASWRFNSAAVSTFFAPD